MERMLRVGGAELCVDERGDPDHPTVLLVAGTSCSMDWWPPDFCELLTERGLHLLRFDQRDTGRSSHDPPGSPSYGLPTLVRDALGVLTAAGVPQAHWVGFSQGGWVCQLAGLDHPDRVRSLTLLSTRPTGHGPADADLPEVSAALLAAWEAGGPDPDWSDPEAVIDHLVAGERSLAGTGFDERHARRVAQNCVRRAHQVRSAMSNHPLADQGPRWRDRLSQLEIGCTVVHGSADPLFPVGNARALAAEIPGARLELLPGVGHELPPKVWARVADLIAARVAAAAGTTR